MEFSIEKCATFIMKSGTDEMEQPNQEKIERLRKRKPSDTREYWKLTPSNKSRRKKKFKKSITGEPETYLRQIYMAEILSKG